jgi:hypothetical protein
MAAFNFPSGPTEGQQFTPPGGPTYVFQSGVWNAVAAADLTVAGDLTVGDDVTIGDILTVTGYTTMSGDLMVASADPDIYVNTTGANATTTAVPYIGGQRNNLNRWWFALGYGSESTGNAGGDFALERYADNGAFISNAIYVKRSSGDVTFYGNVTPSVTATYNLGSASLRWATVYTSDLSLKNEVGDWTIVEGADDLFITNNKNGKKYKFALIEVEDGR